MARIESGRTFVLGQLDPGEADRVILQASRNPNIRVVCYFNKGDGRVGSATYNPYLDDKGNVTFNFHALFEAMQDADAVIIREVGKGRRRLR